jgi:D-beta-D-heptose 7-phosphate kinase/D-beta-D-heptose 1-phosphate adenosyltransferase
MKKIFVNGTFDVLHVGHIKLLTYAKSLGNHLLVALDSDARVREKKGPSRPVNDCYTRLYLINCLKPVDEVAHFSSDSELESIIRRYSPDIMVVGSDWRGKKIIGSEYSKNLIFFDRIGDYSSTRTLSNYENKLSETYK